MKTYSREAKINTILEFLPEDPIPTIKDISDPTTLALFFKIAKRSIILYDRKYHYVFATVLYAISNNRLDSTLHKAKEKLQDLDPELPFHIALEAFEKWNKHRSLFDNITKREPKIPKLYTLCSFQVRSKDISATWRLLSTGISW